MVFTDEFLTESRSARDQGLERLKAQHSEQAILNKVKSLFFAVWSGVPRVSRQQLADFYEVPVATVDSSYQDHKDEFELDGVKVFRGAELKGLRGIIPLSPNSPRETIYTPAGALRMGFLLRDSDVAKTVRTAAIRFIQGVGSQMTSQILFKGLIESQPALSPLAQSNGVIISSPYAPYWDKMKSTFKKQYSTGGIPGMSQEDIRKAIQFCSTYTDNFKLQGVKELSREIAGERRGQYPALMSEPFYFDAGTESGSIVFMFQFQDVVIDMQYVQDCVGRGYIQTAIDDLKVDKAALIFVAPFGATSYAEDYIRRYLSAEYRGYVGVLTVKQLADILYTEAWQARQHGIAKGEITKEFSKLRTYEFPEPPAIYNQQSLFEESGL